MNGCGVIGATVPRSEIDFYAARLLSAGTEVKVESPPDIVELVRRKPNTAFPGDDRASYYGGALAQLSGTGTALVYSKTPESKASSFPHFVLTFDQITVLLNMAVTAGLSPEDRGEERSSDGAGRSVKKSWAEGALWCLWYRGRRYGAAVRELGVAA